MFAPQMLAYTEAYKIVHAQKFEWWFRVDDAIIHMKT